MTNSSKVRKAWYEDTPAQRMQSILSYSEEERKEVMKHFPEDLKQQLPEYLRK